MPNITSHSAMGSKCCSANVIRSCIISPGAANEGAQYVQMGATRLVDHC
jgi:hypothetical protein